MDNAPRNIQFDTKTHTHIPDIVGGYIESHFAFCADVIDLLSI